MGHAGASAAKEIRRHSPDQDTAQRRRDSLAVLLLLVLATANWMPRLAGPIDLRWDAAVYYILGTSLAEGKGYRLLNEPGEIEAVQYPPLLPAIVAAHQMALGTSDPVVVGKWLKFSFFVTFLAFVAIVFKTLRLWLPRPYAFAAAALCAFNSHLIFLAGACHAELPFALAATLCIYFGLRGDRPAHGVVALAAAVAAYLLRTVGIALFAALIAESALKRRWRQMAVRAAVALVPVAGWSLYIAHVESKPEYSAPAYAYQRAGYMFYNVPYARNIGYIDPFQPELGQASFSDMFRRVAGNIAALPVKTGETASANRGFWNLQLLGFRRVTGIPIQPWVLEPALAALGLLSLIGLARYGFERQWLLTAYVFGSLAAICLTPWPGQVTRYAAPLVPFLLLGVVRTLLWLRQGISNAPRAFGRIAPLLPAVILAGLAAQQAATYSQIHRWYLFRVSLSSDDQATYPMLYYDGAYQHVDRGIEWLAERAGPNDILAGSMPHGAYLRIGRKAVMPPFEQDPERAQALIDTVPVKYLLVEGPEVGVNFGRRYASALVRRFPENWRLVYAGPEDHLRIYERTDIRGN